jgi:hypothetical protein
MNGTKALPDEAMKMIAFQKGIIHDMFLSLGKEIMGSPFSKLNMVIEKTSFQDTSMSDVSMDTSILEKEAVRLRKKNLALTNQVDYLLGRLMAVITQDETNRAVVDDANEAEGQDETNTVVVDHGNGDETNSTVDDGNELQHDVLANEQSSG